MGQNAKVIRVTAFTVSELLRENQKVGVKLLYLSKISSDSLSETKVVLSQTQHILPDNTGHLPSIAFFPCLRSNYGACYYFFVIESSGLTC